MTPILFAIGSFISTFLGGMFSIRNKKDLHLIMSFTAGVLIAVCFFDIVPEIFDITSKKGFDITYPLIAITLGFLAIHTLEKFAVIHHAHEEEYADHKHPTIGIIGSSGLSFHSFLDGVGIGLGFHVNAHIGILIAIAVIAHDFSDGINTVALMLVNKNTQKRAIMLLLVDAIAPIIGVLSTYLFSIPENILVLYLGFFAGFLLYIGASDLLPEAHSKKSSFGMIGLTVLGVLFIFLVTRFV